jgi:hypothetical protein
MENTHLPQYAVLVPAYGRDFSTAKEATTSWESGQDWLVLTHGPFCSKYASCRDQAPGGTVELRYNQRRKVMLHKADAKALARMAALRRA